MTRRPALMPSGAGLRAKSNREIRRCLVRYVARQLYRLLEAQPDHRAEVALRQSQTAWPGVSVVGDNFWLATKRLTT
jgi:hypothetical protein